MTPEAARIVCTICRPCRADASFLSGLSVDCGTLKLAVQGEVQTLGTKTVKMSEQIHMSVGTHSRSSGTDNRTAKDFSNSHSWMPLNELDFGNM